MHHYIKPLTFAALIAVFASLPVATARAAEPGHKASQAAESGFQKLAGPQIKTLFQDVSRTAFPGDGSGYGGDEWDLSFLSNYTWEGELGGGAYQAYGSWRAEGDQLCLSIEGGDTRWSAPYEGCLTVEIDSSTGTIAVSIPDLDIVRLPIKTDAYGDLARLAPAATPPEPTPQTASRMPATETRTANQNARNEADKNALELQRLALERQRLESETELQRMRLEMERLRLEREAARQATARQQAPTTTVDRTPPTIDTTSQLSTRADHVTIQGRADDDTNLVRFELDGNRVDTDDGTFSVAVPVTLGKNTVRLTAFDAQGNKSERLVTVTRERDIPEIAFGKYYALVIGINDYSDLPKLNTAVTDARTIAKTLTELYGYSVTTLENPSRADIIDAFDDLRDKLTEQDNLLIYYAGHGWLDQQTGRGYWLPVNAKSDRRSRWISNSTLTDALQGLPAKHVMVVADSCYSGTLTRSIKVPERNKSYLKRISEKRARVVLSSGGLEPVADSGGGEHSVFADQFLKALRDNQGVLDGTQLFERVRHTVVLNANQTPEYSDIRLAGHEGGDFLFVRRK